MKGFELASFVGALFYTYYILIIIRIIFSWVGIPSQRTLLMIYKFIIDVTEPYLGLFRRFIPPAGGMDFSPIIALLLLGVIQSLVVGAL